jgi:fibronectin type III domain protein/F5/8 type C domain-containing protein
VTAALVAVAAGIAVATAPKVIADPPESTLAAGGGVLTAQQTRGQDGTDLELTSQRGRVSDKADTGGDEGAENAFDGSAYSKYLTGDTSTWLQYELEAAATAVRYTLTSANDAPDRDPRNWDLLASPDGNRWVILDSRTDQTFTNRYQAQSFTVTNTTAYRFYRLDITANNGSGQTQLAEFQLLGTGQAAPAATPPTPTTLEAKPLSPDQVLLTWDDNSRWETGYRIERATGNGGWTWSKTVPSGTTRYSDLGLSASTRYSYRVLATNGGGSSQPSPAVTATTENGTPPADWQEHWETHQQLLTRVHADEDVAVYFDKDMPAQPWTYDYVARLWRYTKQNYGTFSNKKLFVVLHRGKYDGGHASTVFDADHDHRSVIDVGLDDWSETNPEARDILAHEISHVVENSAHGAHTSPAFPLWLDSKWAEIYQYDAYLGAGLNADAERWYTARLADRVKLPPANTLWFKDWFYPIWRDHGKSKVLAAYFEQLSKNFLQHNQKYARNLNWGEFVHFWSGAAGTDLKPLATGAFGWSDEWEAQLQQARRDFPGVTYSAS